MKRRHLFAWLLSGSLYGCAGGVDVEPALRDFDRYDVDLQALEIGAEAGRSLEAGRQKRSEAATLVEQGKSKDAAPMAERALADARLALEMENMEAARRDADRCRLEVERARSKWKEALFVLQQTEEFAGRKAGVGPSSPPAAFEFVHLPASALDKSPEVANDPEKWDRWRAAARERGVASADLEAVFRRSHDQSNVPKQAESAAAHHAYVAGRALQSLECRTRAAVSRRICREALQFAAELADARSEALGATLELERGLQAGLRGELEELRVAATTRQDELYAALSQMEGQFASIHREARGTIVSLADILFDFNKATLRRNVEFSLVKIATILNQFGEMGVLIEGHTDSIGTDEYNLDLSRRRAKAVFEFLMSQDVAESRLSWEGYGESRPAADNDTDVGRQQNRRVDLVIQDTP
ncbi:MAG: hypothetical protein DHS20C21_10580 [Gemmatimonadota bacterium]|nr:MAG: hypothetical protein DHS20C21_10580 [Gemmatimonadota bacterium]